MKFQNCINALVALALIAIIHHAHAQTSSVTQSVLESPAFSPSLVWTGTQPPSEVESTELLAMVSHADNAGWTADAEQFLQRHPHSPWAASLRHGYALYCRSVGRTTKALEQWEAAWELVKADPSDAGQKLAGAILANWMEQLASLGRAEKLQTLVTAGEGLTFASTLDRDKFQAARNSCYLMQQVPGISFRCGTFALKAVGIRLQPGNPALENLPTIPSPKGGFSMAALLDLAHQYKLNLTAVRSLPTASGRPNLLVPSVVHWRADHYAAILEQRDHKIYLVSDPTFGTDRWLTADVINEESGGEFLVPSTLVTNGWQPLTPEECEQVHGQGLFNLINDALDKGCIVGKPCPPCLGMPVWWISEPYINLWMADEPVSYRLANGKPFTFRMTYKQRDTRPDKVVGWNNSWYSYITPTASAPVCYTSDNGMICFTPASDYIVYLPEGGTVTFPPGQNYDPETRLLLIPQNTGAPSTSTVDRGNNGFRLVHPDGAQDIYGYGTGGYVNLSRRIDADGNTTWIQYGAAAGYAYLPKAVIDPDGRTNTLSYDSSNRLVQVDTPYGLSAKFKYDNRGNLTNLTDAQGLVSRLTYDSQNNPTALITPYGTNLFSSYVSSVVTNINGGQGNFGGHDLVDRAFRGTDAAGATSLWLYRYDCEPGTAADMPAGFTAGEVPIGTPLGTLDDGSAGATNLLAGVCFRNSFFWGPRQLATLSSANFSNFTAGDYLRGRMRHWLQDTNDLTLSAALSVERAPSLDGTTDGLKIFYDYPGKTLSHRSGTSGLPSVTAWRLPGGETHYDWSRFDYFGNVTNLVTTATLANGTLGTRTNQWIYQDNVYGYSSGILGQSGVANTNSFTVPNLLSRIIAPDGQTVVAWGGYSPVTWTNYFLNGSAGSSGTNVIRLTSSRTRPEVITNGVGEVSVATWSDGTPITNYTVVYTNFPVTGNAFTHYNQLTSFKSFSGLTTTNLYDANGFLIQTIDLEIFRTNSFGYTSNGLVGTFTNELGLNLALTWDNLLRPVSVAFPDGTYTSNRFDKLDLGGQRDRMGNWTGYGHDGARRLSAVTNANLAVTRYDWCGCGALNSVLDALNNPTLLAYDTAGRNTGIAFPDNSSVTYQLDLAGRMTNAFDGANRIWRSAYNHQGLVTNTATADGSWRTATFDLRDRPIIVTDENGVTITNLFDNANRLIQRTWPDGISEGWGYNAQGLFAYTNRNGQVTRWLRDVAGRTLAETNANLEVTQYTYNAADEIRSLTDGLNHTRSWQYDANGWLTNKTDGLNRNVFRSAYNANGWLTNRWTPEKGNLGYALDAVGNVTNVAAVGQASRLSLTYDLENSLLTMQDLTGLTRLTRDAMGRVIAESNAWTVVSRSYTNGLRTSLTITQPGTNWTQSYAHDHSWRLTNTASSTAGGFIYEYAANVGQSVPAGSGLSRQVRLPNGAYITNSYDALARLKSTALQDHWRHTLDGYTYAVDALGMRTNVLRDLGLTRSTVNVGYDGISQITSWNGAETNGTPRLNEQLGWAYDAANNIARRTNNLLVQNFTANAADELTGVTRNGTFTQMGATPAPALSVTVNGLAAQTYSDFTFAATNLTLTNGFNTFTVIATNLYGVKVTNVVNARLPVTTTIAYDANGNLTNDGVRVFGWDAENQLTNVTVAGAWKKDFVFDGLNRMRIKKEFSWNGSSWVKTNETRFVWDGDVIVQLRDSNNVPTVTLTRGVDMSGSLQGAGGIGGLLAMTDTSGTLYYHSDGSGNVTALMDGYENVLGRREYDAFGKSIFLGGRRASANPFWFSSQLEIAPDIYGYKHRAYAPAIPGWLSNDPIGEWGGRNLRQFVASNPLNEIDPWGLWQSVFRDKDGKITIYDDQHPNGTPGVKTPWDTFIPFEPDPNFDPNLGWQPPLDEGRVTPADGDFAPFLPGGLLRPKFKPTSCPVAAEKVSLEAGKQAKHIPGSKNYIPGRSPLTHKDPQGLLDKFAGKGQPVGKVPRGQPGFKERVNFGEKIGEVNGQPTTKGIIHYSKDGAHIVPANP